MATGARRLVSAIVCMLMLLACSPRTADSPRQAPVPDLVPLWPEHTPEELAQTLEQVRAGGETADRIRSFRANKELVAAAFVDAVLGWSDYEVTGGESERWRADDSPRLQGRVHICRSPCTQDGDEEGETIHLQLVDGLWVITSVEAWSIGVGVGRLFEPRHTMTFDAGSFVGMHPSVAGGELVQTGSSAWGCSPEQEQKQTPTWYGYVPVEIVAPLGCSHPPGVVFAAQTENGSPVVLPLPAPRDLGIGEPITPPADTVSALSADAIWIDTEPEGKVKRVEPWQLTDPRDHPPCTARDLELTSPGGGDPMPPRPYSVALWVHVAAAGQRVCRANFDITLALLDTSGRIIDIPGNSSSVHVERTVPNYPGARWAGRIGGLWGLAGYCVHGPVIVRVEAFGEERHKRFKDLYACSDYRNFDIPLRNADPVLYPRGADDTSGQI